MKKNLMLIAALMILCVSCTAHADGAFTLRNGVHFGDSESIVKAAESWEAVDSRHIFHFTGPLAGKESLVYYRFDDDHLKSVLYVIGTVYEDTGRTRYSRTSSFEDVEFLLMSKYGTPMVDKNDTNCLLSDEVLVFYASWLTACPSDENWPCDFEKVSPVKNEAKWIVQDGNNLVLIQLAEYPIIQNGENCCLTLLSYCTFTQEEAAAKVAMLSDM